MIESEEEFNEAVDAIENLLTNLWYAATERNVAEFLVDQLPSQGYKIVKMTPEEIKEWEEEIYLEIDEDVVVNKLVWDENPYLTRMVNEKE